MASIRCRQCGKVMTGVNKNRQYCDACKSKRRRESNLVWQRNNSAAYRRKRKKRVEKARRVDCCIKTLDEVIHELCVLNQSRRQQGLPELSYGQYVSQCHGGD